MALSEVPLLSVVIPVRSGMPHLVEAVTSALREMGPNMELIVRDNFSTDGTSEYLATLRDPRVLLSTATTPASAGANWSAVCDLARGTYTKVLCADDTILPGGLVRQVDAAVSHPSAVLIASRRRVIDDAGKVVIPRHGLSHLIGECPGPVAIARAVRSGSNPFGEPSSVLFRTDALRASLPFTEEFPYLTDLDMYVRVLRMGSFVGLGTVDATFRLSANSWSKSIGTSQLREYRRWRDALTARGELVVPPATRAQSDLASTIRFLGRRAVTAATSLVATLRR